MNFVKEVAAFAIPDKKVHYNYVPALIVTIKNNMLSLLSRRKAILAIGKEHSDHLSPYKRPSKIIILKEMPRTNRNKINYLSLEQKYG